jgi:hypothetical protein
LGDVHLADEREDGVWHRVAVGILNKPPISQTGHKQVRQMDDNVYIRLLRKGPLAFVDLIGLL